MQQQSVSQPVLSRQYTQPSTSRRKQTSGYHKSAVSSSRERRTRTIFSNRQLNFLEGAFQVNKFPNYTTRCTLAQSLDLDEFRVNVWFHNRRAKWRKWENGVARQSRAYQPPSGADTSATTPENDLLP
ncbi:Homeobox protein aristales [Taenia solium]|eukprot:TsM_000330800 transcript=TsM_000330800 gene=TsM_000330800